MAKSLTELTVELVTAQLSNRDMSPEEIAEVLRNTFHVLKRLKEMEVRRDYQTIEAESAPRIAEAQVHPFPEPHQVESAESPVPSPAARETEEASFEPEVPAMDPMDSIHEEKIICLECGHEFKQISHTHLKSHGLTPKEYRKKYLLPAKQPLTARSLSEKRKLKAKEIGLGGRLKRLREAKQRA